MLVILRQVKEFVDWIQQQDFYENTTIVIAGDHPTMDKDFCEDVDDDYDEIVDEEEVTSIDDVNENYLE